MAQAALPAAWGRAGVGPRRGRRSPGTGRKACRPRRQRPAQEARAGNCQVGIKGGVVHATAATGQFAGCQAQKWGASGGAETVVVRGYLQGGGPGFVPFTVTFSASSGAGLRSTYCTTRTRPCRGRITRRAASIGDDARPGRVGSAAARSRPGRADGRGTGHRGQPGQARRLRRGPGEQDIRVRCQDVLGAPRPSGWSLTYRSGRAVTGTAPTLHAEQPAAGSRAVRAGAARDQL